ncbi:MAG TPA: TolC family protein [Gemmatimonadaceae bacterium]|nr:TolC family protein [Gemmatimonadaceae bacterium]
MTRLSRFAGIALLAFAPSLVEAQRPAPTPVLSLPEALDLARQYNPAFQQIANNRGPAGAAVRSAYGNLLPTLSASLGAGFQQGGTQVFQGATIGANSDVMSSNYGLSMQYRINAGTIINPRVASANRAAVEADVVGNESVLRSRVTQQYLTVLQSQATAALQDTLVATARAQLALAEARAAVGSATPLDVRRAEVALGQQRVTALQAHNTVEIEKLRLFQEIGIEPQGGVQLTTEFPVVPLGHSLDDLLGMARQMNPVLRATEARERAASLNVSRARTEYTPTLFVSTGWGGYTRQFTDADFPVEQRRAQIQSARASCFEHDSLRFGAGLSNDPAFCETFVFTDQHAAQVRAANSAYPFDFTKNPWSISASLSIPLFDGLGREQRLQEATASRNDARHELRAREIALHTEVTSAYLNASTALQSVALQEENAAAARGELTLAEERFRVGAATFLEVTESRSSFERALSERINAIYEYHKAIAVLESAVGRPLR